MNEETHIYLKERDGMICCIFIKTTQFKHKHVKNSDGLKLLHGQN